MITYLILFAFLILFFSFMVIMLYFSKYKQRNQSCCADGVEDADFNKDSCFSCPSKDDEECNTSKRFVLKNI